MPSTVISASDDIFFKNKTVRMIVGFGAGGGFDIYSRAIARHMGKHIPGNPSVVVENMTGAGSLLAANHLYKVAKPDGLTIGNIHGNQILNQVLGSPGVEFDARRFEWIGVPVKDNGACALTKASGITSLERWRASKTPVKLGGGGPGDTTTTNAKILKEALNLPIQLVMGYKGTSDMRLAAESGELAGLKGKRRGPERREKNPLADRVRELERENARLKRRAERAEGIVELQKKVSEILGIELGESAGKD